MKAAAPTKEKTGKEQQFTAGVMARLFPKPIISPEFVNSDVIFRFKAPEAKSVKIVTDLMYAPVDMKKDADGVWEVKLSALAYHNFKYYFDVDGMKVADPSNMYLSPDKGAKQSVARGAKNVYNPQNLGNIPFGKVSYNINDNIATYQSVPTKTNTAPDAKRITVALITGKDGTVESWFKDGCVNFIADKIAADEENKFITLISATDESKVKADKVLRADDFRNWEERVDSLIKVIKKKKPVIQ